VPFKSAKQRAWAYTDEGTKALGGTDKVKEWEDETPSDLPTYANGETTSPDLKKKFQWAPAKHRAGYKKSERLA